MSGHNHIAIDWTTHGRCNWCGRKLDAGLYVCMGPHPDITNTELRNTTLLIDSDTPFESHWTTDPLRRRGYTGEGLARARAG